MLKRKCKVLLLLIALITLASTLTFATVEPRTSSEDDIMPISETDENNPIEDIDSNSDSSNWSNSDLYLFDDKVEINQVVDGNVFVFANEVVVSGEIGGDLFVFANKLTIEGGYVYSSVFAVANEISINGIVYDVYAASNKFTLEKDGFVYRDLKISANTINLNGKVKRDAYITAANYNFSEENDILIGGNLKYSSNSEINIPEGIVVGEVIYNKEIVKEEPLISKVFSYIFDAINGLIFTFVVVLLALWLAPKFVNRVTNMNTNKAFISLGVGVLAFISVIIALFILLISGIASILSVACLFIFIAICMSGTAFASIYFGSLFAKLVKWDGKVKFVLSSLISALIIWAISQLPFIGNLFGFLIALFGIGTLLFNVVYKKDVVNEIIETKTE